MDNKKTDVFIAGGGIAGMIASLSFASLGYTVICVDPTAPVIDRTAARADMRSTAFLQPSKDLLTEIGLWQRLQPHAAALQIMRIVDAGGKTHSPRIETEFNADEISDQPFGWNFPNWLLRRECLSMMQTQENITFKTNVSVSGIETRANVAYITLSNAEKVTAKLLVAADGRDSKVRTELQIDVRTMRYGQKALAFTVNHPIAHQNVSTEIHRSGGPFTLVPLPDQDDMPTSAIVWMERAAEAMRLKALAPDAFEAALNKRSCGILGPLTLTSSRTIWPIISQYAKHMCAERTALIAEAAHVVPPIGAQGLNMSLGDLKALYDLAKANPGDIGSKEMLDKYHKARHPEVKLRILGIDALNRASMLSSRPMRDLRALGLKAIYGLAPVRKSLMKAGLGARS